MVEDFEEVFWGKKIFDDRKKKNNTLNNIKLKFYAYLVVSRAPVILVLTAFLLLGEWYAIKKILDYETALMIIFLVLAEFINGLTNSYFDKKLDIFARKHTLWVFKYISPKEMLLTATIFSIISFFLLGFFFNFTTFILGLILIIITLVYSIPPIRLKTKAPMDVISNMLFFGSTPFILGWLITGKNLNCEILVAGLIAGISVLTYNLIIGWNDIKTDAEYRIKNTFVRLNYDWTINVGIILWIILMICSYIVFLFDIITLSFIVIFPVLFILWLKYLSVNEYSIQQKNINYFLYISFLLWLFFVFFSLIILTKSIIPMIMMLFEIILFSSTIINKIRAYWSNK